MILVSDAVFAGWWVAAVLVNAAALGLHHGAHRRTWALVQALVLLAVLLRGLWWIG